MWSSQLSHTMTKNIIHQVIDTWKNVKGFRIIILYNIFTIC